MNVQTKLLPMHDHTRSGIHLPAVRGVVFHYPRAPGWSAEQVYSYIENIPRTEPTKMASYHYIVGLVGENLQMIPENECAWASGPSGDTLPDTERLLGGKPNWRTISICMCHPDKSGEYLSATLDSARELAAWILRRHNAKIILRHYDCTGKYCPAWFVDHPDDWEDFQDEIRLMV